MTTPFFSDEELQELHSLARGWAKIISKRAFGDAGPGLDVDFRTFEQIATVAAQGLTEGTLELLLEQQADKVTDQQPCPDCGTMCPTKPHTRTLTTKQGQIQQRERIAHCPACRRDFFPLRPALGLDEHTYSCSVIEKVVTASARFGSFKDATAAVVMSGIEISESQVRRLAHEVGQELIQQRDRKAVEHRQRKLLPRAVVVPAAVVVEVDGGRIRTRAEGSAPGVHDAQNKEDKIACLATMSSQIFEIDPQPEPTEMFLCPRRVQRLVQQMKGGAGEHNELDTPVESSDRQADPKEAETKDRWSPELLVRTCVASLESSGSFGPLMAAEAQERRFYDAPRRAFVADGMTYNWSIQDNYFRGFEPIVDLFHVLCYVYLSAHAVSADETISWSQYVEWMRACWQGRVGEVIGELDQWQERLGQPPKPASDSAEDRRDPRRVVYEARTYLRNNQGRMDYPRYRREGLPTTSSLVESLVGEFNARVKSKQKHWVRPGGAESILQLRAAMLSQDDRLSRYFSERPGCPFRKRPSDNGSPDHHPVQTAA
jgi:hypothetical protein